MNGENIATIIISRKATDFNMLNEFLDQIMDLVRKGYDVEVQAWLVYRNEVTGKMVETERITTKVGEEGVPQEMYYEFINCLVHDNSCVNMVTSVIPVSWDIPLE